MAVPTRLVLATRNEHKVREILRICADWPVEWVTFREASWPEVEETGDGYLQNASLKADSVASAVGAPALADDSGIEVDALGGAPGPRSARFAGDQASDRENLRVLIERIRPVPERDRSARYRCVAVCAWPDGRSLSSEATCEGRLISLPRGSGGFGYDPIFVPDDVLDGRTMAELLPGEKDAISHRGRALRSLRLALEERGMT
jgi:XTP/dITP diphosphohydrolase